jgi:GT2 family glycosyltransferase
VQHGKTGFLVPFGDVGQVAHYVRQLCNDKKLIASMGEQGLSFIKGDFSHDALYRHLETALTAIRKSPQWNRLESTEITQDAAVAVTVVIPVYNAYNEVGPCIESVIKHTPMDRAKVLIINDGSTDSRISELLSRYADANGVRVIDNNGNIGYTKTVNSGIREAGRDDVILLNSDTVVTPNWLAGLRAAAYAETKIGTVTAMSDNAGAFSFPIQGVTNPKPDYMSHDDYAMRVIQATIDCKFVDVPTGSGFCMYLRRKMIDGIGMFDEAAFPRGYGEENDYCMRAIKAGWRNIITPWSFVYHVRTASFKGEKEKLVQAGVDVVTRRYPEYSKMVRAAFSSDAMNDLRNAISNGLRRLR